MALMKLPSDVQKLVRSSSVIPNYASAISELVYNSLDADAYSIAIRVDIIQHRIQVIDNGVGIAYKDMEIVGDHYVSSKYHKDALSGSDPKFYGFRGEALANLISLSETVTIASRSNRSQCTHAKTFSKGKLTELIATKMRPSHGTTITIKGFMYNIKVRRECIKQTVELQHVCKCIRNISLLHYGVSFTLRDDNESLVLLESHKCTSLTQSANFLFGDNIADGMERINAVKKNIKIEAYISKEFKPTKKFQFVYVNRRVLINSKIQYYVNGLLEKKNFGGSSRKIIKYKSSLFPNDQKLAQNDYAQKAGYPAYIIKISCPNRSCDISYLPNKTLIEFTQWNIILKGIRKIVDLLNKNDSGSSLTENRVDPIPIANDKPVSMRVIEIVRNVLGKDMNKFGPSQVEHAVKGIPARRIAKRAHLCNKPLDYQPEEIECELREIKDKINGNMKSKKSSSIDFRRFVSTIEMLKLETVPMRKTSPLLRETPYIYTQDLPTEYVSKTINAQVDNNCETDSSTIRRKYCEFSQRANELVEKFEQKMIIRKPSVKKNVFRKSLITNRANNTNIKKKSQQLIINHYQLKKKKASELGKDYRLISHRRLQINSGQIKNVTHGNMRDHTISRNALYVLPKIKKIINDRALLSTYDLVKPIIKMKADRTVRRQLPRTPTPIKVKPFAQYLTYNSHKNYINQIKKKCQKHKNFTTNNNRLSSWLPFNVQKCIEDISDLRKTSKSKIVPVAGIKKSQCDQPKSSFSNREKAYKNSIKTNDKFLATVDKYTCINVQSEAPIFNRLDIVDKNVNNVIKSIVESPEKHTTKQKICYTDEAKCYVDDFTLSVAHHTDTRNEKLIKTYNNSNNDILNEVYDNLVNIESTHQNSPISSVIEVRIDLNNENLQSLERNLKTVNNAQLFTESMSSLFKTSLCVEGDGEVSNPISNLKSIQADNIQNSQLKSFPINLHTDKFSQSDFNNNEYSSVDYFQIFQSNKIKTNQVFNYVDAAQVALSDGDNFNKESNDVITPNRPKFHNETLNNNDYSLVDPNISNLKSISKVTENDKFIEPIQKPRRVNENTKEADEAKVKEVKNASRFQVVQRLNFVPKGLSPILEGYNEICEESKNVNVENDVSDYFNQSIYEAFLNDIEKYANVYEDGALKVDGFCTNDLDKAKKTINRTVSTLTFSAKDLEGAKVINQLDNKFIVAIMNGCRNAVATDMLVLFDQHAVHERIRLEKLMYDYKTGESWKTCTRQCFELPLGQTELDLMANYCELFDRVGLKWKGFDGAEHAKILVTSVPLCIQNKVGVDISQMKNLIGRLISDLSDSILWEDFTGGSNPGILMDIVRTEACRNAIKFGAALTKDICEDLLRQLSQCKLPFQCAHGRPSVAVLHTIAEMDSGKQVIYLNLEMKINLKKLQNMKNCAT